MKLPLSWLREWVDFPWSARELAERLTLRGFEVESIEAVAGMFSGVTTAHILAAKPHPQADKLQVCTLDDGCGTPLQIVCGAPNARAGLNVALARVGAELPGGMTIKAAKLRGVESSGMLCSARELGMPDESAGILELAADVSPGIDLRAHLQLDDEVLEIAVTPNRGDAMSVLGIAREIAAASGQPLRAVPRTPTAGVEPDFVATHAQRWPVQLTPGAGCARFASCVIAKVDNTRVSPQWLRQRLARCGLRSISPVVDVTNLVLLELGQPMHAYDRAALSQEIRVRRAAQGEALELLNGQQVTLDPQVLVIADRQGAIGLAGVMGGARTTISASTRDVVLEVAWFDPAVIAGRARRFGLLTDASQRFERGVDPRLQERALRRAVALIAELAGGEPGPIDLQQLADAIPSSGSVPLRARQIARLLGLETDPADVQRTFESLGCAVAAQGDGWQVTPPSWRFDLSIEADLIEELARCMGLERIPEHTPAARAAVRGRGDGRIPEASVLQLLAARGYRECITFGFVDPTLQQRLCGAVAAPRLRNPIAADLAVMRNSLWPGLLSAAQQNLRRQQHRFKLCELASTFHGSAEAGGATEIARVAGLVCGARLPEQWGAEHTAADYFDVKADVEALLAIAGPDAQYSFHASEAPPPSLHPGRHAEVRRHGRAIGWLGELQPQLVREFDLTYAPILFELEFEAIAAADAVRFAPVSQYPAIRRDISFTVDSAVTFSAIAARVSVAAQKQLHELRLFDLYQGKGVENGRKSVALGLILQDLSRTLRDDEGDRIVATVVAALRSELGAVLRE